MALLDETGVARLWEKMKLYVDSKLSGSSQTINHNGAGTGVIVIGDMCIEFGQVSITSGTEAAQSMYTGSSAITFTKKFKNAPCVIASWKGRYNNMHSCGALNTSQTGATIWGKTSTASSTREIQWIAIGALA